MRQGSHPRAMFLFAAMLIAATLLVVGAAPPVPNPSPSFYAVASIVDYEESVNITGVSIYYSNFTAGKSFINSTYGSGKHLTTNQLILNRYDLGASYQIQANSCYNTTLQGTMPNPWDFLANAVYNGTQQRYGLSLDVWVLSVTDTFSLTLTVQANSTNTPVTFTEVVGNSTLFTHYLVFQPDAEFPQSIFNVPAICDPEIDQQEPVDFHTPRRHLPRAFSTEDE